MHDTALSTDRELSASSGEFGNNVSLSVNEHQRVLLAAAARHQQLRPHSRCENEILFCFHLRGYKTLKYRGMCDFNRSEDYGTKDIPLLTWLWLQHCVGSRLGAGNVTHRAWNMGRTECCSQGGAPPAFRSYRKLGFSMKRHNEAFSKNYKILSYIFVIYT